ncbi:MAG: TIGR01212 family radical SAM protein [Acidobacteriota bacterium]|jgi:radical SAM protein (TIGR01212 family)|nr:TIGR01212 family radical SAM protein [Acidobacteriota bacterium]
MDERWFSLNRFFRQRFGARIRKIPLNAGFSCPNRDGSLDTRGCIYCDAYGSGPLLPAPEPVESQISTYIRRHPQAQFMAYFQAFSNTYAPPGVLRDRYGRALRFPAVRGIFIGTRPDCINAEVIDVLNELSRRTYVCVELGLQSIHDRSLKFLNRHHDYAQFLQAYDRLQARGLDVVVHLILGIPGETQDMMRATIQEMNRLKPRGIKLHMLHVLRNTQLESMYRRGGITLFCREDYVRLVADLLEELDPDIVIHRLTGERNRELFVAPDWALQKAETLNRIQREMIRRDTWQGKNRGAPRPLLPNT